MAFGVYLHVPFCARRCDYCAFATWTDRHHHIDAYLAALTAEIECAVAEGLPVATSVFVGGGTPSLVDADALAAVIASIPVATGAEVTVECNPDDVDVSLLATYRDAGVNRVSVGVQSMSASTLAALGRQHDPERVVAAVEAVRRAGLPTFNLDLIFGAAGESLDDWEATVAEVLDLGPPHVSAYALTVEAGTPLARDRARHPDDDDQADKYHLVDRAMEASGRRNYEISNWALSGHECRHNQLYWRQGNYRGFGAAAHSHRDGRRWWNVRTPERYIAAVAAGQPTEAAGETLDPVTRDFERQELLLRTDVGVPLEVLDGDRFPGLVEPTEDQRWVLTPAGRLLANEIAVKLRPARGVDRATNC